MLVNLIKLRKGRGLFQEDMAKMLNIATSTYSYWESGRNEPDLKSLITLADFFYVSVDYLLGHDKTPDVSLIITKSSGQKITYNLSDKNLDTIISVAELAAKTEKNYTKKESLR